MNWIEDRIANSLKEKAVKIIDILGHEKTKKDYFSFKLGEFYSILNKREYLRFKIKILQTIGCGKSEDESENPLKIFYGLPFFRKLKFEQQNEVVVKFKEEAWQDLLNDIYNKALDKIEKEETRRKGLIGMNIPIL